MNRPIVIRGLSILAPFVITLATGCTSTRARTAGQSAAPVSPLLQPTSAAMNQPPPARFKVLFETTEGDFIIDVDSTRAPIGARRFYNLVHHGYYDGVRFFRVVPGFVVQFGISGDPAVASAWRSARLPDDATRASNTRGSVTFATSGPNTRTVQLFINLADNSRLDATGFAPIGRVTGGMDVVERLHADFGEGPPRGRGPDQNRIQTEGETYLQREFAQLDRVVRARIITP
jgi:peptidyl-prolyl cis-trans isomerase A (cyclophilin A)